MQRQAQHFQDHAAQEMLVGRADIPACFVQVIKESQRLFPAAAIGPIRYAAENTELGGYFIPKGTRVQVCIIWQAGLCPGRAQPLEQAQVACCDLAMKVNLSSLASTSARRTAAARHIP